MRVLTVILALAITASSLVGCSKGNEINGRSLRTANRSVNYIKNRLPVEKRIEFEVSYWSVRDDKKTKQALLDAIDGKTPEQLIELGKEIFIKRKNAGLELYAKYNNWEEMIADYAEQRKDAGSGSAERRNGSILYKL